MNRNSFQMTIPDDISSVPEKVEPLQRSAAALHQLSHASAFVSLLSALTEPTQKKGNSLRLVSIASGIGCIAFGLLGTAKNWRAAQLLREHTKQSAASVTRKL
jgi:hypothetical protein